MLNNEQKRSVIVAVKRGIVRLSSRRKGRISKRVQKRATRKDKKSTELIIIFKKLVHQKKTKKLMQKEETKKAREPSRDLLARSFVLPYLIPTIALKGSEMARV